jgi:hypothetical protein
MSKKKRSKSALITCPVEGCGKTGTRSAVLQHAAAKHPRISHVQIKAALSADRKISEVSHPKPRAKPFRISWSGTGAFLTVAAALVLLVLLYR